MSRSSLWSVVVVCLLGLSGALVRATDRAAVSLDHPKTLPYARSLSYSSSEGLDESLIYGDGILSFGKCISLTVQNDYYYGKSLYYSEASYVLFQYGYHGNHRDSTYFLDLPSYMAVAGEGQQDSGCVAVDRDDAALLYAQGYSVNNANGQQEEGQEQDQQDEEENYIQWYIGYRCSSDGSKPIVDFFMDEKCTVYTSSMKTNYESALTYLSQQNYNNNYNNQNNNNNQNNEENDDDSLYQQMVYAASMGEYPMQHDLYCYESYTCQELMEEATNIETCQYSNYANADEAYYNANQKNDDADADNQDGGNDDANYNGYNQDGGENAENNADENNNNYYNEEYFQAQTYHSSRTKQLSQSDLYDTTSVCGVLQDIFGITDENSQFDVTRYNNAKHIYLKRGYFTKKIVGILTLIGMAVVAVIVLILVRHNNKKNEEDLLGLPLNLA